MSGELEDSTLAVGASADASNVGGVVDSGNDAGGEDDLLPGLANVNDMDTW